MSRRPTKRKEKKPEGPPEAVVQLLLTGDYDLDAPGHWPAWDIQYDRKKLRAAWEQYKDIVLREWTGPGRPWAERKLADER